MGRDEDTVATGVVCPAVVRALECLALYAPERQAGATGNGEAVAELVSGNLPGSEHAALSREAERGTRNQAELHVGAEGAARSRIGAAWAKAAQLDERGGVSFP